MLNGLDISKYQWNIDLSKVPCDFVIIKATGGPGIVNSYFKKQVEQAISLGKLVGAYHFALDGYPNKGPEIEARHFVDYVKPYLGKIALAPSSSPLTPSIERKRTSSTPRFLISSKICIHWCLLSDSFSHNPRISFCPSTSYPRIT